MASKILRLRLKTDYKQDLDDLLTLIRLNLANYNIISKKYYKKDILGDRNP